MDGTEVRPLVVEHQELTKSVGFFNVKSVILSMKIAQLFRAAKDTKMYRKYVTLAFLGSLSIDMTEEIQVDICCDMVSSLGRPAVVTDNFKNLLASYIRSDDIFGLCNTLAATTREDDNHDSVWEHVADTYHVTMLKSLALDKVHSPFSKSAILFVYGELLRFRGDYDGCVTYYKDSLKLRRELLKADETHLYKRVVAQCAGKLGVGMTKSGHFDDAERILTEALTIRSRIKKEVRSDVLALISVAEGTVDIADLFFAKGETCLKRCKEWYEVALGELEDLLNSTIDSDVIIRRVNVLKDRVSGRLGYVMEMLATVMMREAHDLIANSRRKIMDSAGRNYLPKGHPSALEIYEMGLFSDRIVNGVEAASDIVFSKMDFVFGDSRTQEEEGASHRHQVGDPIRDEIDKLYNEAKNLFEESQLDDSMTTVKETVTQVMARLGKSEENAGVSDDVEEEMLRAHPRLGECLYLEGEIFRLQGRYSNAMKKFDTAGKVHMARQCIVPLALQCMLGVAECYLGKGNLESCAESLQEAMSMLLCSSESDGNSRRPPQFQYDTCVTPVDNLLMLAQILQIFGKLCVAKGYYNAALCAQHETERFLNKISDDHDYNVDMHMADSQYLKAKILLAVGQSAQAVVLTSAVVSIYNDVYPANTNAGDVVHYKVADTLLLSAEAHIACGNFSAASGVLGKALDMYRNIYPEIEHDNIAWCMYLSARATAGLGRHIQTEVMYNEAVAACKRAGTMCSVGVADSFQAMGRYHEAGETYRRVLAKVSDKSHPFYLQTLLNIAKNQRLMGRYNEAKAAQEEFISRRPTCRDHSAFLKSFEELSHIIPLSVVEEERRGDYLPMDASYHLEVAELHRALGEFSQANMEYEKSMAITRNQYGARHQLIADVIFWQVENLRDSGYGDKVTLRPSKKALHLRKNLLGDDHIDVAMSMQTLGDIDVARGDYVGGRMQLRKSLAILENKLGSQSAAVSSVVNSLGRLHTLEGDFKDAERYLDASLKLRVQIYGERSVYVAESLNNFSEFYRKQNRREEALSCGGRSLTLFRNILGESHPKTLNAKGNWALLMTTSSAQSEIEEGKEKLAQCLQKLLYRSTGEHYILTNHPWIRKFKAGARGTGNPGSDDSVAEAHRLPSDDEEEEMMMAAASPTSKKLTPVAAEKLLTWKLKKLKSDNEYLKTKNDEYVKQVNSLKAQIRLLEVRVHNAEEISAGKNQLYSSTINQHFEEIARSPISDDHRLDYSGSLPVKKKTIKIGSLAASLGYARSIVKQQESTDLSGSEHPSIFQTPLKKG